MRTRRTERFRDKAPVDVLDAQLEDLFRASRLVALGQPLNGSKLENLDAVWLVHAFGLAANTDETTPHALGRMPIGMMNVELPGVETGAAPVVGTVTFGSLLATDSLITIRCTAASKVAAVILF